MSLTIRARLTLLYFGVLTGALLIFVLLCDYGFQRSINTTVNEASLNNLESVRRVIDRIGSGRFLYKMDNGRDLCVAISVDKQTRSAIVDFTGTRTDNRAK